MGFHHKVLWSFNGFASAQPASLKSMIQDNLRLLLIQTVAAEPRVLHAGLCHAGRGGIAGAILLPRRAGEDTWPADTPRYWLQFGEAEE